MARFFHPQPLQENGTAVLSAEESHHLVKVLRLGVNDRITLFDGKGRSGEGIVLEARSKAVSVQIRNVRVDREAPRVHVVFGIAKGAALDTLVRKCVELGVASLQPVVSQNSLPAKGWNEERWDKVIQEVGKQCEANFLPEMPPPVPLAAWLARESANYPVLVCDEAQRDAAPPHPPAKDGLYVVTGPEGGWSAEEREAFRKTGAVFLGLGKNRLRAETAAVVATTLAKQFLGELPTLFT